MTLLWFPAVVGFLGSAHCLGMCGPIVVASSLRSGPAPDSVGSPPRRSRLRLLLLQSVFHLGRLTTYAFLGGMAALFTRTAEEVLTSAHTQSVLTSIYGLMLIFLGLALMRLIPVPASCAALFSNPLLGVLQKIPALASTHNPSSMLLLGLATGLLPCCLSWSMIITAASAQTPFHGSLMMVAFGAGTLPALFLAGLSAAGLVRLYRRLGEKLPGLILVGMGLYLVLI
ncbi:MAG: sulfite exporter TauE/SafE family protein [Syntrophobacteraceae bacterium]|nr:sulfite exporter TauE/SafE family protein [Syntrophobacteraceae bacterium]MCU0588957.1 sulfite exporter TauE/SafE family protein [Syntrophobacteraceae bacterium]